MDFNYLYAAQFMVQAGTAVHQYNRAEYQAQQQRQEAYRQVALNNKLAYNAHLNLNQQQVLELKKFGLDDFELKKSIRREKAKSAAMQASAGGIFGKQGTSYQAVQNNIARYGYNALVRKDVNFQTKMQNFETRHNLSSACKRCSRCSIFIRCDSSCCCTCNISICYQSIPCRYRRTY